MRLASTVFQGGVDGNRPPDQSVEAAPTSTGQADVQDITDALFSFDFSLEVLSYNLSALIVAFLLALPVAWDREQRKSSPGLRTFPLVAIASCAYVLVAISVLGRYPETHSRLLQGLATGIGFIGGGAILKSGDRVTGTATAASIWVMGAMGAAVAYRRLEIALLLTLVTFGTLRWLQPLKRDEESESATSAED